MHDANFETTEQVQNKQPPESAEQYIAHEKWLDKHYRDDPLRSIEKEIEGMARLFNSVVDELDEESKDTLLDTIQKERVKLRRLEEDIQGELPAIEDSEGTNH